MEIIEPADIQAEQIVIGSAMNDYNDLEEMISSLSKQDFYDIRHVIIFDSIAELKNSGDVPRFQDICLHLDRLSKLEKAGGAEYIKNLEVSSRGIQIKYYIEKIKEARKKRDLIKIAKKMISSEDSSKRITEKAIAEIISIETEKLNKPKKISETVSLSTYKEQYARYQNGEQTIKGTLTGWKRLDSLLGGLRKQELIILGARPSMGKSEVISQLAINLSIAKVPTLIFSMEMTVNQICNRLVARWFGIRAQNLEQGMLTQQQYSMLCQNWSQFESACQHLTLDTSPSLTTNQIKHKITMEIMSNNIQVVLIDHLSKIGGKGISRYEKITDDVGDIKRIAQEMDIPIILAAQLNRNVVNKENPRPNMADLRDSGAIEQDADKIILIHRPDYYKKDDSPGIVEFIVDKNREGERDIVKMFYCIDKQRLSELSYDKE